MTLYYFGFWSLMPMKMFCFCLQVDFWFFMEGLVEKETWKNRRSSWRRERRKGGVDENSEQRWWLLVALKIIPSQQRDFVLTMAQISVRPWTSTCFIPYQLSWPVILPSEKFRWIAVILPLSQLHQPKSLRDGFPRQNRWTFSQKRLDQKTKT